MLIFVVFESSLFLTQNVKCSDFTQIKQLSKQRITFTTCLLLYVSNKWRRGIEPRTSCTHEWTCVGASNALTNLGIQTNQVDHITKQQDASSLLPIQHYWKVITNYKNAHKWKLVTLWAEQVCQFPSKIRLSLLNFHWCFC